jgi:putative phosphoribosyl transferase
MVYGDQDRGFADREDAGRRLAEGLEPYGDEHPLILGIPRGGVPVAAEVARRLNADLDIVAARKLGAPGRPELAIGATTANGGLVLDEETIAMFGATPAYLESVIAKERAEAQRRESSLRGGLPKIPVAGRTVIVIDDGLATGSTVHAAVRSVQKEHPARLIVAVPVGSRSACEMLRREVDRVVCLQQPEPFIAVGLYYGRFAATEDEEVQRLLKEAFGRRQAAQPHTS